MNNIDQYLKELLFQIDKVAINGLGTFNTFQTPARINEEQQVIEPPRKGVRFAADTNSDEDYFTTFLSEKENLTRVQSLNLIEDYVKNIRKEVIQNIGYTIEGVGTFIEGANQELRFIADPKANFSTQSYGLKEVELPERQTASEPITSTPPTPSVPIPPPATETYSPSSNISKPIEDDYIPEPEPKQTVGEVLSDNVEPENQYLDEDEFEYEEEKSSSGLLRWLLPFIALLLVLGLVFQLKKNDSGLSSIPPFSFFMGDDDDDEFLAENQEDNNNNQESETETDFEDGKYDEEQQEQKTIDQLDQEAEEMRLQEEENRRREIEALEAEKAERQRQREAAAAKERQNNQNSSSGNSSSSRGSSTEVYYQNEIPKGYYGVVGVFGEKRNAQKTARKMKDQGRNVYMVKMETDTEHSSIWL